VVSVCLLLRHAAHDLLGQVLVGRRQEVALSGTGRQQAFALIDRLQAFRISAVQSSPQQRCLETAAIVASARGLEVAPVPHLDELDYGVWTGCSFAELEHRPDWRRWNSARAATRPPLGESMREAQSRVMAHLAAMHAAQPRGAIVMVTHAEVIRAAVLKIMALPLDDWGRIEVPPASVTRIEIRSRTHAIVRLSGGKAAA
jgi:broad specificity phosphatase PhoE